MKVIFVNVPETEINTYGKVHKVEVIKGYDKQTYLGVDIDHEYDLINEPIIELENGIKIIKWFESNYEVYLTENKLELFRKKIVDTCHLTNIFTLNRMKEILIDFIQHQQVLNVYSLIEFAYEYPGVLIQESQHPKEPIPTLYMMFEPFEISNYEDDVCTNRNQVSIKQHNLMFELPMNVLTTYYGLLTKISQVYRSLFPNTWSQAYFNFTTDIIIHPLNDDKMIVITQFCYYHGYDNHPNTHTLLDNIKTVQLLKDNYTVLNLVKDYDLNVPFPIIYGVSEEFYVNDDNMSVKVTCYHPELSFNNEIKLTFPEDWKIPGDDTFGYLDNKDAFDPHQYHYILRRLTRRLYRYDYKQYICIMSEYDLPDDVMYFYVS